MPRIKLSEKYHNEREELCKKLINIVGTEFLLCDLDNNIEKQTSIIGLKNEIQQCFAVSAISSFKPNITDVKRDYLNIVRSVLRKQGYLFIGCDVVCKNDTCLKRTKKYTIFRNI